MLAISPPDMAPRAALPLEQDSNSKPLAENGSTSELRIWSTWRFSSMNTALMPMALSACGLASGAMDLVAQGLR